MNTIFESTLLVVDDEPEILIMVKKILNLAGFFQVLTAGNCQQAREIFDTEQPQGVTLDVMLPD